MKFRKGFITNSSSTAYLIKNISDEEKSIVDFVRENLELLYDFNDEYDYKYTEEEIIKDAYDLVGNEQFGKHYRWGSGESRIVSFGDEHGTVIGHVYDYILRECGKSKSFTWSFHEYLR